jgi:glycosyltransferase involved in cell wall biosynthesis
MKNCSIAGRFGDFRPYLFRHLRVRLGALPLPDITSEPPLVTVVIATYNRSAALAYALRSVCAQTLADWECLVVGDACTDDTAAVVAAFGDERIRFENLPVNVGDQSGPNNHGCARARGRFIAFLNHDDLWLPEHLRTCVEAIEATAADLVVPAMALLAGDGTVRLVSLPTDLRYNVNQSLPASAWLFRRELFDHVGPWRHRHACYNMPSQDWLFRVWKAGRRIAGIPLTTLLLLPSGTRRNSYLTGATEQAEWWHRIEADPGLPRWLAVQMAALANPPPTTSPQAPRVPYWRRTPAHWARTIRHLVTHHGIHLAWWLAPKFGLHPKTAEYFLRYRRRGGFVDALRRWRGLDQPASGSSDIPRPVA